MLKTCFVIQRFDGAVYDKRYRETFAPAIERAGAKAVRADEVLGTKPVVEKIEAGLRTADVAFAEISEDNPNVFLELGFALSLNVPTVIVCDRAKRHQLPFDIAHRPVMFYSTDAQSDYENISRDIFSAMKAALLEADSRSNSILNIDPSASDDSNIDNVKSACLIALLDRSLRSPGGTVLWEIQKEVSTAGISERMVALAIASLVNENIINRIENEDRDGDTYNTFVLSESGTKFLLRSYSSLMQEERERVKMSNQFGKDSFSAGLDEDVPF